MQQIGRWLSFKGRATRSEFALVLAIGFMLCWAADLVDQAAGWWRPGADVVTHRAIVTVSVGGGPLLLAAVVCCYLPTLAVCVRRLHDSGRSGWWVLLWGIEIHLWVVPLTPWAHDGGAWLHVPAGLMSALLTGVGSPLIVLFYWWLSSGNPGANRYGPQPKQIDLNAVFA